MAPIIEEQEQLLPGLHSKLLGLALKALSEKALLWVCVIGAGAVWAHTIMHPEPLRIVTAAGYSMLVFWPILWASVRNG